MLTTAHNNELALTGAEFQKLVSGCAIYDLGSRSKIKLTGSDRVRWLNGMVTNNIRDLAVGHGVYAFLLNPQGRIQGDLYAYNREDSLWLDTDREQVTKMLEIFDHYIIMDDVEIEDCTEKLIAIGIGGPKARNILRTLDLQVDDMQPLEVEYREWNNIALSLVRCEKEKGPTYEIWASPENKKALWDALIGKGAEHISTETLELYRIALGIPCYGQDIRERDLPQETGQTRALNFSKGCYVGQEIVERIRSRGAVHRTFSGFKFTGDLPPVGTKVQADGKDVGEITSAATLPLNDSTQEVALGYIRREADVPGKEILTGSSKGTVAKLPFIVVA